MVFLDTLVSRLSESSLYVVAFVDVKAGSVEARRLFLDYDESNQIEQVIRKLANLQPHGLIPVWLLTNSPRTVRPMWRVFSSSSFQGLLCLLSCYKKIEAHYKAIV